MRLLYTDEVGKLKWTEDLIGEKIPAYAILSHTWEEGQEVTFHDLRNRDCDRSLDEEVKSGYRKISFCAKQAKLDGLHYFWVDTCCIDKTNSVELQEAINSMFRWYQRSKRCYVYLPDVETDTLAEGWQLSGGWKAVFRKSRWFTRGWTLQELLAPVSVEFFSTERTWLGDKKSLEKDLCEITGIPVDALPGTRLRDFSVEQRFSWTANRHTTREEDQAYCLLGIFGVHLPLIYGEGKDEALVRLRREVRDPGGLKKWCDKICAWLSPPDPSSNYNKAHKQRQAKTGLWLLDSAKFKEWKAAPASRLWLHGIPGCGKTILSSTIIEYLLQHCDNGPSMATAYFYFDFRDTQKQDPELMLCSLLCQLLQGCVTTVERVDALLLSCGNGRRKPSQNALLDTIAQVIQRFDQVHIVLDALDECAERTELLDVLETLAGWQQENLHILMTSRKERDIESSLEEYLGETDVICLQSDVVDGDIQRYVQERLSHDKSLIKWNRVVSIRQEIETVLMSKARGMFRWAVCQLDSLGKCHNRLMLRKALATLPATLDQTYERILCAISEEESKYALRILRWLAFSEETLSLNELAEVVAIDITRDPAFNWDEVLEDPLDALGICSSLVTIATVNMYKRGKFRELQTIALAHYSVQEYLLSDRIKHGRAKQYSLRKFDCHDYITKSCLKYLLQFNRPQMLSEEVLDDNALARYSAQYWASHLRETDEKVEETICIAVDLLTLDNPAFLIWSQLYDPDEPWKEPDFRLELADTLNPLYCAAMFGLSKVSTQLLNAGADVDAQCGMFNSALEAACVRGHEETVKILLDAGANINLQGEDDGIALELACGKGYEQIVRTLLDAGADVNKQRGQFGNALQAATFWGHEHIVKLLLDAGANGKDGDISAPLGMACEWGHKNIVEMLLNTVAGFQDSRLSRALEIVARAGYKEKVEMLLSASANQQDRDLSGAIEQAAEGHVQLVEMLLSASATQQDRDLSGAIQKAAVEGHVQLVKMLLSAGASISSNSTSLWWACTRRNEQLVMMLLEAGATGEDGNFSSEIQIAEKRGHKQIVEKLRDARTRWSYSRSIKASKVSSGEEVIGAASRVTTKRKRS